MREARIDLSAIRDNVAKIRRLVAPARVLAVVKANGYGHGLELAARAALEGGADQLGVADLAEALQLRAAGIDAPVLAWLHAPDADFDAAVDAGIEIGVSSREQLERAVGAVVHLKIDTGLSRNGIPPADWDAAVARAAELERTGVLRVRGVWSHLANAGARETERQRRRFEDAVAAARAAGLDPEVRHLAASEAAIAAPATRYDLVRIGIAMYGLPPAEDVDVAALGLRPAMELAASVAAVRRVPAGRASRTASCIAPSARRRSRSCLWATPTGCRAPRRARRRSRSAAAGIPSSAGSRWTSASSTWATRTWRSAIASWCGATPRPEHPPRRTGRPPPAQSATRSSRASARVCPGCRRERPRADDRRP
ncbi:hypothetical protein GCM10025881_25320 [Pseudolysinimonas kribbensis]|uniref:Alanine racemase N-terminal domain-containing protein n=1 Tax=Pseudolysinimonas kribbensis TaxID=433641 RepID=A0ABQ6K5K1_9MICO|nr:hypothetical protein GCM10025881_25320 [Pseudolysinimonas kribbensis]